MATDIEKTPFVKQLASSDRASRDRALESLRTYLHSSRPFTELELIKLWRGLFFCMWHSDRPKTQQRLARDLSHLVLPLQPPLFVPFLRAFWATMATQYPLMDGLRLDKFLLLMRFYANAAFTYLSRIDWDMELLGEYLNVIEELLLERQGKVSDGLRYHVLDLWVEELAKVDAEGKCPLGTIMGPVEVLKAEGRTKTIRERAKECLADERLNNWAAARKGDSVGVEAVASVDEDEDEWGGIEDED